MFSWIVSRSTNLVIGEDPNETCIANLRRNSELDTSSTSCIAIRELRFSALCCERSMHPVEARMAKLNSVHTEVGHVCNIGAIKTVTDVQVAVGVVSDFIFVLQGT
jgi:hypothetical protein